MGPVVRIARSVTAAEVTAAAHKYVAPASLTAVVVGQIDAVRAARHPRWPVALEEVLTLLRRANRAIAPAAATPR